MCWRTLNTVIHRLIGTACCVLVMCLLWWCPMYIFDVRCTYSKEVSICTAYYSASNLHTASVVPSRNWITRLFPVVVYIRVLCIIETSYWWSQILLMIENTAYQRGSEYIKAFTSYLGMTQNCIPPSEIIMPNMECDPTWYWWRR